MPSVAGVFGVPCLAMTDQILPRVVLPLVGEDFQIFHTQVTQEQLVLPPQVGVQFFEGPELPAPGAGGGEEGGAAPIPRPTDAAGVPQEGIKSSLCCFIFKVNQIVAVQQLDLIKVDRGILLVPTGSEHYLANFLPTDGTLVLITEDPHLCTALCTDWVVAGTDGIQFSSNRPRYFLTADYARPSTTATIAS